MPYVSVDGVETYYERHGNGHPLVFVHGGGWDHRQWTPQRRSLAGSYEVISYDVRGHGKTGGSDRETVTDELLAEDLRGLLDTLDVDDPTLVGLSMGGKIAHKCAATYPDVPGSLVTYEAPVQTEPQSLPAKLRVLRRVYLGVYRALGAKRAYTLNAWFRERFGDTDARVADDTPVEGLGTTKAEYIDDAVGRLDTAEQLKYVRSLGNRIDDPAAITVPTLVLTGDRPDSFNRDDAETLAREIPDARTDTIPDAGHAGNIDNPDAFDRRLIEFVSNVHGEPPGSP